jgi:hypothetical protein
VRSDALPSRISSGARPPLKAMAREAFAGSIRPFPLSCLV